MTRIYKYQKIKSAVAKMGIETLIDEFNALVVKRYWTASRAAHDVALINTFIKKGIDVSEIYDGTSISFQHKIALNSDNSKIILA